MRYSDSVRSFFFFLNNKVPTLNDISFGFKLDVQDSTPGIVSLFPVPPPYPTCLAGATGGGHGFSLH